VLNMDQQTFLFWIIATLTGLSAISVVVTQNIVRSAAWLLFTLGGTAGLFFLLGADFVGATQLIVYVGGILVLVVFGVMLTAQGPFITMRAGAAEWAIALVVGITLLGVLGYTTYHKTWFVHEEPRMDDAERSMSSARLGLALLGFKEITPKSELTGLESSSSGRRKPVMPASKTPASDPTAASPEAGIARPGSRQAAPRPASSGGPSSTEPSSQLTPQQPRRQMAYLLPFEIVSVHLLVVLIGAAYLARAKRRRRSA
jgi:NADH-quinone oxidoreductase subunit J